MKKLLVLFVGIFIITIVGIVLFFNYTKLNNNTVALGQKPVESLHTKADEWAKQMLQKHTYNKQTQEGILLSDTAEDQIWITGTLGVFNKDIEKETGTFIVKANNQEIKVLIESQTSVKIVDQTQRTMTVSRFSELVTGDKIFVSARQNRETNEPIAITIQKLVNFPK